MSPVTFDLRCVYMDKVMEKLDVMETEGCSVFDEKQLLLQLLQADSACQQGNFSVAMKILRATKNVIF